MALSGISPYCQCPFDVGTSAYYGTAFDLHILTPGIAGICASKEGAKCDFGPVGNARVGLAGLTMEGINFTDAIFEAADLTGSKLSGCTCKGAVFSRALLANTDMTGSWVDGAAFDGCDLTGGTILPAPPLADVPDQRVSFEGAKLPAALLRNDWSCLDLTGATVLGIDNKAVAGLIARYSLLPGFAFSGLNLDGADFSHSVIAARPSFRPA